MAQENDSSNFFITLPRRIVYPTYEDLANKHGCHIDTIRHKASKQKPTWAEQKSALKPTFRTLNWHNRFLLIFDG